MAEGRDAVYLDMERMADRQVLGEPDLYLDEQIGRLVVIDEIQLLPNLFKALRGQIDRRRRVGHRTGQFLLLDRRQTRYCTRAPSPWLDG
ncbi:hypothetical protein [Roseobacter sp. HKCCD8198]|uniref:hypothetical protein n=1 Tax=unclassified Roseobacter TaxID=196798 RepID=UPI003460ED36